MKSKENNILRALMRTVALPAAALTLPVSQAVADVEALRADLRTSWTASSDSVNAVADADLTAVEAQITALDTYIENEETYQGTLGAEVTANEAQALLDQAAVNAAQTAVISATTAKNDADAAVVAANTALAAETAGTPEYTAAETARDNAEIAAGAAETLLTNATTTKTDADASLQATNDRGDALDGAITRSENRVDAAGSAKDDIQDKIDAKGEEFSELNDALDAYKQNIYATDDLPDGEIPEVVDLDQVIATVQGLAPDEDGINDTVDPTQLPVADDGTDLSTAYLNNTANDPIAVEAYVAEATAALASLTAPITAAEQTALLNTLGNGAFEREAIQEVAEAQLFMFEGLTEVFEATEALAAGEIGLVTEQDGIIHLGAESFLFDDTVADHVLTTNSGTEIVLGGDIASTAGADESKNIKVANNLTVDGATTTNGLTNIGNIATGTLSTSGIADVEQSINDNSDAINTVEVGAGLNPDGTYAANAAANYISTATSLYSADQLLDTALQAEEDARVAADALLQQQIDVNSNAIAKNRKDIEANTRGIAMVAALQHTTVLPGMNNAFDLSAAHFEGETGMALNYARRINENVQINFGAASTTDFDESVIKAGIGVQW